MQTLKTFISYCFIWLLSINLPLQACTIFMANDGQNVWIGNNEDEWAQMKYRIWYYPVKKQQYGYCIWTELSFGTLLNGLSYLNPQGGLNEYGLFIDFTTIDEQPVIKDDQKKNRKKELVTDMLKTCKTVEEALAFVSKYNLIKLTKAQLFVGDATGDYATITGSSIVRKTANSFALTNYPISGGHQEACHRRDVATHYLNNTQSFDVNSIKNILEKSAQQLPNNLMSNYSMAVNLKTSTIYLYYKNDFTTVAVISLTDELKKGKHDRDMENYFPKSIAPVLERGLKDHGVAAVTTIYRQLRLESPEKYNFKNEDALHVAIGWIEAGRTEAAISLLTCLIEFDSLHSPYLSWLGVAYRKANNLERSDQYFKKAFALNPGDYVATLFGKQQQQRVRFNLPDFEAAEKVLLMGEFTEWLKHPIPMKKEKGVWTCELVLPKGEVTYKFIVNDQYLADSKNYMHVGSGADVYSKLYVW